jgi:EAL domain-containing protein (putative c-di-GMP-specific phosphodiesterase class I)/DNA-binding LytR/AlgR family response regulator
MSKHRILIVDDNKAIHEDFRKILCPESQGDDSLAEAEAALFGAVTTGADSTPTYHLDFAFQGDEALEMVRVAQTAQRPYAVTFIDVRMPPGWDGVETTAKIWEEDPDMQVVICTAYSDYSWKQMLTKLGHSDRLVILKKPFDNIEVQQLADTLTHKWHLAQRSKRRMSRLENLIRQRTKQLDNSNARLDAANQQLIRIGDYDADALNTQKRQRLVLESKLQRAIETRALTVHYQPLLDIATRRVVGLEALARWEDPEQGAISPAEFIPVAEESGLIVQLGEFVLRTVCEQIVSWQRDGVPVVPVAVNVSAAQMERQPLAQFVRNILRATGVRPELIALELTESALIKNAQQHLRDLQTLRADGVQIEIDDFGTGYSSLSYLKHLPVDALKIDRSFITHIDTNPADESIVRAILAMAHSLGLKVVAEGVETAAQLDTLRLQGCEIAQGFFFSRALPAPACRELLLELAARPSFTDTLRMKLVVDAKAKATARALVRKQ